MVFWEFFVITLIMSKIKVSAPILTLNSGKNFEKCLESIKDFAEIIILDGNSTDNTVEIAKKYGAKIYLQVESNEKNVKIENFGTMRVKAMSYATEPWIFVIDSDEYADAELIEDVRRVVNGGASKAIYKAEQRFFLDGKLIKYHFNTPFFSVRLFKKDSGVAYNSLKKVHESPMVPKDARVEKLKGYIYSNMDPLQKAIEKDNRYLEIFRKKMQSRKQEQKTGRSGAAAFLLQLNSAVRNFLMAIHIILMAAKVYVLHGFKESIPPLYILRYVRYHLIISWIRFSYIFK